MQNQNANSWLDKITAEHLLYALLLLIGFWTRLYRLAQQPLSSIEATNAWPAWLAVANVGSAEGIVPTSALLYTFQTTFFWLVGAGDVQARLLSAIVGALLILLAWQLRGWLGRVTALTFALLVTVDPWLVVYSRLADSAMLSIGLGLLILVGLIKLATRESQERWTVIVSIGLGLLLISGPQSWNFLPMIALFVVLFLLPRGIQFGNADKSDRDVLVIPQFALFALIGSAVLGATSWLARPEGLGYTSASLTVWRQQLTGAEEMAYGLGWVMLRMIVDQPLLLVFGIMGLTMLWTQSYSKSHSTAQSGLESGVRHGRWRLFLTLWLVWGVILMLMPGRNPFSLIMLVLPLIFLASHAAGQLWHLQSQDVRWRDRGILLAVLTILSFTGIFWISALSNGWQFEASMVLATLIVMVLMLLVLVLFALWSGWRQTRFVGGLFLFGLLFVATISGSWQLNHRHNTVQPDGFFAEVSHPTVKMLAHDIEKLSAQRLGDAWSVPVLVEQGRQSDPVLGWYLRDMRRLTWVLSPKAEQEAGLDPVVIATDTAADATTLPENYLGSDYALSIRWLPKNLTDVEGGPPELPEDIGFIDAIQQRIAARWSPQIKPLLRWILFRESKNVPPVVDSVLLWTSAE